MIEFFHPTISIILVFIIGYFAIIFEHNLKINKTASALFMAVLMWMFVFFHVGHDEASLGKYLNEVSQIIFFLLGAMTIVELINSHRGFQIIVDWVQTRSKRKILWISGFITFFLSAIFDNLTTAIVMIVFLRKLVPNKKELALFSSMVVIAANAGGAWSPIGDVTTTMLWIHGNISAMAIIKALLFPSAVSLIVSLFFLGIGLKGEFPRFEQKFHPEPGGKIIFWLGVLAIGFVPVFKILTGLPPFMGMLIALGVLWILTDLMHHPYENRQHLRIPEILMKIDVSGLLFFLGIILCIGALDVVGILENLTFQIEGFTQNIPLIATIIGLVSAVIDNIPLVAATIGMYDLNQFPMDSKIWQMIAFTAGTGGSILIIGSAAGIALMSLEKINFWWYFKRISWIAAIGYFAGIGTYLLFHLNL